MFRSLLIDLMVLSLITLCCFMLFPDFALVIKAVLSTAVFMLVVYPLGYLTEKTGLVA